MADIVQHIDKVRESLLDLSPRNRLLSFRLDGQRVVRVHDESADQVFQTLVLQKKPMGFRAEASDSARQQLELDGTAANLEQPEGNGSEQPDERHADLYLQTRLTSKALQTRLLRIETEARIAIEEQGANILYLALGFLKWFDSDESNEPRYAPLILVPARLHRTSAASRFKLSWSEEDLATNESLAAKLKAEFGLVLPPLPGEFEEFLPSDYFEQVRSAVRSSKRWEVTDEISLGFFTFAKLLMWRDLDIAAWPAGTGPHEHPVVRAVLESSPVDEPPLAGPGAEPPVDHHDLPLITDADGSQVSVILDVMAGHSITVQGPPGTGKSQTITNIIACALAEGKTVLFVAEKMAALEVVKRRLDAAGLGDACLELHSFKARKTHVAERIRATLEAARPAPVDQRRNSERVKELRDQLDAFASAMNTPLVDGGITPHRAIGLLRRHYHLASALRSLRLAGAADWSVTRFEENLELVRLLAKLLEVVGEPVEHPWRGVTVPALLPSDLSSVRAATIELRDAFAALQAHLHQVVSDLSLCGDLGLAYSDVVSALCGILARRPDGDLSGTLNDVWQTESEKIRALVATGACHSRLGSTLREAVREDALDLDFRESRRVIAERGQSPLRLLFPEYWRARRQLLRACLAGKRPRTHAQALKLLSDLCGYRELGEEIASQDSLGQSAFGERWHGVQSDWQVLESIVVWVAEVVEVLGRAAVPPAVLARWLGLDRALLLRQQAELQGLSQAARDRLSEWRGPLSYDAAEGYAQPADMVPLARWVDRLTRALERAEAVYEWIAYRNQRERCKGSGLGPLAEAVDAGRVTAALVVPQFESSCGEEVVRQAQSERVALREFNGEDHEHLIEQFRTMDRRAIELTRQYMAAKLWERMPSPTVGDPDSGAMNYLTSQLRRKRGIPAVRELMTRAGSVIVAIKPCFMMSPMSVAQFLPPGAATFDLLVIDEASQMRPADALGVMTRCRQSVIVGDTKQLPPSSYFETLVGGDSDGDDLADVESILDAAALPLGGGTDRRLLRWHYRSRHESLIAFSNREFYDSRLYVFPSPRGKSDDLGVIGHYVAHGVYGRGGSRKNLAEAHAVAQAVLRHAERHGDLSLGVVALSSAQQEAIQDKLEELRRGRPDLERFFSEDSSERFFIKNLETVQGDERDVIFISIGYGKDERGYTQMNFGPINREGGWRRLNVLITRARRRCEVFHSIRADEIRTDDLTDAQRYALRGRIVLRNYLAYVETGELAQPEEEPDAEAESIFEESVAAELEHHRLIVKRQVGVAGFRVDLAIVDPAHPGRCLLGVECDGATYHRARAARDRDRLRQEVLEGLGWRIHRVWSLDWLKDPGKELRRLLFAVEEAKVASPSAPPNTGSPLPSGTIVRTAEVKEAKPPHEFVAIPYQKAQVKRPCEWDPGRPPIRQIAAVVEKIVAVESPVHVDEVARRIAEVWGFERTGSRISAVAREGIVRAKASHKVIEKGGFLWDPTMVTPSVRDRSKLAMGIERVAPEEIQQAAAQTQAVSYGMGGEALVTEIARCLGYARTTAAIAQAIRRALSSK